ncbi:UNVERIFIED_CONTAM: hypothetical protein Sradi_5292200 [Sesamum radiatum]|uniref:CCHC-type domain-containing protein n=1 Tax=Sesamum radiatum TaxID=300843 RepID=A0AAW2LPJ2_SESRA
MRRKRVFVLSGLWKANLDFHKLCVVGRLLSNKPFKFEALCSSIRSMILPVKGMDIRQLEEGRILIRFNHIIDKQRALEGCPSSFEKNILFLNSVGDFENPMHVALEVCDFYVHVHDLPLSMMNRGVATLVGNRIGVFRELDADDSGYSWGAYLRLRVGLNVNKPLKRAMEVRSMLGEELLVRFTYERLPNFCYLCGILGHIDRYCQLRFSEEFEHQVDPLPYGAWLRAPVRRIPPANSSAKHPFPILSSSQRPSGCKGPAIFGNFSNRQAQNPRTEAGSLNLQGQASSPSNHGGSAGEEVDSSLFVADDKGPVDMEVLLAEPPISKQKGKGVLEMSEGGLQSRVEGREGDPIMGCGDQGTECRGRLALNLVNVLLHFTTQSCFPSQGVMRRGRHPGRGVRGRPRKRDRGIQIIEAECSSVHEAKRRLLLVDDMSDSISAETARQSRQEP